MRSAIFLNNTYHGQDRIVRTQSVLGVLDGVSESDGALAAEKTMQHLSRSADIREALLSAHEGLRGKDALTTAVVADLKQRRVYNIGDSPAFFVDETGITELTTLDRDTDEVNIVTQAVGSGEIEIHEASIPDKEGFLLLMSDGVSDNISPERLRECCAQTRSPRTVVRRVVRLLERRQRKEQGFEYEDFKEDDQALVVVYKKIGNLK